MPLHCLSKGANISAMIEVSRRPSFAQRLAEHLRRNLLWYSLMAILLGWGLGVMEAGWIRAERGVLKTAAQGLVFLMIYPMMVNLNLELLPRVAREPKPVLLSLFYNFALTPLIAIVLVFAFVHHPELALGFFLVMLIPGSSMAVGYTGLAGGSLEVATLTQAVNFLLIPLVLPLYLALLAHGYRVQVPIAMLLWTILLVLILPMFLGDLTRRAVLRRFGKEGFLHLKPWLGSTTMLTMLLLVGLIFAMKGEALLQKGAVLLPVILASLLYLAIALPLITWLDKKNGLPYAEHMGVAFVSSGKNNGTAIAIAVTAMNPMVALPAAILPLIQIVALIGYLNLAPRIRAYFGEDAAPPRRKE